MCRLLLARFESSLHLVGNMLQAAFCRPPLLRYRVANQRFRFGQRVFHIGIINAAVLNQRVRGRIHHLHFAVGFGHQHAQRQLQREGGVFHHQRRARFGRAEHNHGGRLHG